MARSAKCLAIDDDSLRLISDDDGRGRRAWQMPVEAADAAKHHIACNGRHLRRTPYVFSHNRWLRFIEQFIFHHLRYICLTMRLLPPPM